MATAGHAAARPNEAPEKANPEEMEPEKEAVDSAKQSEVKNLEPQEDSAHFNSLLKAALSGDTEEVQHIFEDLEDPDHEKATELLTEKDVVGRDLLYTTCMCGQSDVIRTMAKYGVDLKKKTPRAALILLESNPNQRLSRLVVHKDHGCLATRRQPTAEEPGENFEKAFYKMFHQKCLPSVNISDVANGF